MESSSSLRTFLSPARSDFEEYVCPGARLISNKNRLVCIPCDLAEGSGEAAQHDV